MVTFPVSRVDLATDQALLFDMDGVVVHPFRFAEYLAREHGLTRDGTSEFFQGVFLECLVGRADLKTAVAPFLASWGWPGTVDQFLQRWFAEDDAPDQRMLAAIADLRRRGLPCYLATNQERYRLAYMREQMGFGQLFDGIFASAEIGAMKHDQAFYAAVTTALGLPPGAILFWDDSATNVAAARAYGWHAELYTDFDTFWAVLQRSIEM